MKTVDEQDHWTEIIRYWIVPETIEEVHDVLHPGPSTEGTGTGKEK